ncbi:hypothetical protein SAMN05443428_101212 [Caloramator quimbayensis]|uniref:Uncharacterized protein n=1 Tax=Caloramator quimbayensis TaxID=1147123 RepID=A0A1T4WGX0_9CLOT|nr:hypothetical protein [Caloramator quimbayensis]SKA76540.1 hypothetical protein SAMN05443428_101212 [Caloramator quimbayensis]
MLNMVLIVVGLIISGIVILIEALFSIIIKGIIAICRDFFGFTRRCR